MPLNKLTSDITCPSTITLAFVTTSPFLNDNLFILAGKVYSKVGFISFILALLAVKNTSLSIIKGKLVLFAIFILSTS